MALAQCTLSKAVEFVREIDREAEHCGDYCAAAAAPDKVWRTNSDSLLRIPQCGNRSQSWEHSRTEQCIPVSSNRRFERIETEVKLVKRLHQQMASFSGENLPRNIISAASSRTKVNPAPSTNSRFSGTSLVSTQSPAHMASSSANDRPSISDGSTKIMALVSIHRGFRRKPSPECGFDRWHARGVDGCNRHRSLRPQPLSLDK